MQDVVIIGGGICGCSLLYELSRYKASVTLLEKENDLTEGATKANSAIVHAGYDPHPDTLMARYNVEGNRMIEQLCADLDVLYRKNGSLVIGFSEKDRPTIEILYQRGISNGVPGIRIVEYDELHKIEPNLNDKALLALYAPSAGIVSPWELAFAQAQAAVESGAEVRLESEVTGIRRENGHYIVETSQGNIETRFVVNAAGRHCQHISEMLGEHDFTIVPRRGQYFLLDTTQGDLVEMVIFQCPTELGKGILVSPTVHGNLIVGPNSEFSGFDDLATTSESLAYIRRTAQMSVPGINFRDSIRNFSGIRAELEGHDDFIVGESCQNPGYFRIAGIKSPGLTAAPAIARDVARMISEAGLQFVPNPHFRSKRSILRFKHLNDEQRANAIKQNPLYGNIVCRCMSVTEGEIVDVMHRPIPPRSIDGVKRRCWPGSGRCQGGFCGPRVQEIIARELGVAQEDVPLDRNGMNIIIGRTKQPRHSKEGGDINGQPL